jgi:hypothetical protein
MSIEIKKPKLVANSSGIFEIRYSEKTANGYRSRVLSTRTTCRDAAEAFLTNFIIQSEKTAEVTSNPRIKDLCAEYSSYLESEARGRTSQICVENIRALLGDYYPSDLHPSVIRKYKATRNVSSGTLRRELSTLRTLLIYAENHGFIDRASKIDLPPPSTPRRIYLKSHEEKIFHRIAMDYSNGQDRLSRISRFVAIGLCTGQRAEAVVQLTWDRVDLVARTVDFRMPGRLQSKKRQSKLPISDRLLPILRRAWDERTNEKYVLDTPSDIRFEWKKLMMIEAMAPYRHITPHCMRKTFITLSIHAGVSVADVAALVGDTVEVILRNYLCELPEAKLDAVNARL